MPQTLTDADFTRIPSPYRAGLQELLRRVRALAGEKLLTVCPFGGWLHTDPFARDAPAWTVLIFSEFDIEMLDRLAESGAVLGDMRVHAPLVMTPEYVQESLDSFPLELLEIQQLHTVVYGTSPFTDLHFERSHVRLQCERELKGVLIQLRQGLLAAAGRRGLLGQLCDAQAERCIRILRGMIWLAGGSPAITAQDVVQRAQELTRTPLPSLRIVVASEAAIDWEGFRDFYSEVAALLRNLPA